MVNNNYSFTMFLDALASESLLKILASPVLTTTNGQPANMLSGGEFPILVPQSLGTVTIQWKEFGVRLTAVPLLLGNGRVRLNLQPEVSQKDLSNSVTTGGLTVPALTTRRVNTSVEMRFGETFMLGGLIECGYGPDVQGAVAWAKCRSSVRFPSRELSDGGNRTRDPGHARLAGPCPTPRLLRVAQECSPISRPSVNCSATA